MKRFLLVLAFALLAVPALAQTATPASKLQWDQIGQTASAAQAASYNYYVDTASAAQLVSVQCVAAANPANGVCTAPFPALAPGPHTISVSQFLSGAETVKSNVVSFSFVVVVTPSGLRVVPDDDAALDDED